MPTNENATEKVDEIAVKVRKRHALKGFNPKKPPLSLLGKLHTIQGAIGVMSKEGTNEFSHYQYLTEAQVTIAIKEQMDKMKVLFTYSAENLNESKLGTQNAVLIRIHYTFWDVDWGEKINGFVDMQGADKTDKSTQKAITAGVKYIYMKTFNIPTGDDPEVAPPPRKQETPQDKAKESAMIIHKIKETLNKLQPNMNGATALKKFRDLSGLGWTSWNNITLTQARLGYSNLLANQQSHDK